MKPKLRIILTVKRLYELAGKRYVDFETPDCEIRLRLDDNYTLEIQDITPNRISTGVKTPPNMVN